MKPISMTNKVLRPVTDFSAALFDLDGTILDSMYVWHDVDVEFLRRRNLPVTQEYLDTLKTMSFVEAANHTIALFALDETPEQLFAEWHELAYREYAETVELLPGVKDYLQLLAERDIRMGVGTLGTPELYRPCLARHGLLDYFDVICDRSDVSRGKDHPDLFLLVAEKLNRRPDEILLFEDIPEFLATARRAGFRTCGVNAFTDREAGECDADFCIDHFDQAPVPNTDRKGEHHEQSQNR